MVLFPSINHSPKFVCGIIKNVIICVQNHEDNYFLINIAYRSDANMIKWSHAAIFANFELQKMI